MIPKRIIEKAIEGGWDWRREFGLPPQAEWWQMTDEYFEKLIAAMWFRFALDPSFWQALGKALGWQEEDERNQSLYRKSGGGGEMLKGMYKWHKKAMRFYDLILTNGDTEKFWEEIAPTNTI